MKPPTDYAEPERRILFVHGMWTKGVDNLDRMAAVLENRGHPVALIKYKPVNPLTAVWRLNSIARTVIGHTRAGDVAIGHSYGCLVIYRAMELEANFGPVVYFSASMERKVRFPHDGMTKLLNVTHPYDRALSAGRWIPWHPSGLLGRDGYGGERDSRITEMQSTAEVGEYNHTAPYFCPEYVDYWADQIDGFLSDDRGEY